jgi:hypothetical protein
MEEIYVDVLDVTLEEIQTQIERLIEIYGPTAQVTGDADLELYVTTDADLLDMELE